MHRLSQHFQDMNDFSGLNFLGSTFTFWFTLYGLTGDFLSLICIMDGERMLCLDLRRNLKRNVSKKTRMPPSSSLNFYWETAD